MKRIALLSALLALMLSAACFVEGENYDTLAGWNIRIAVPEGATPVLQGNEYYLYAQHSGFLFLDNNGMPEVAMHWEHRFNHMVHRYNDIFREQMPNITPHYAVTLTAACRRRRACTRRCYST